MTIRQGDIYWVRLLQPNAETVIPHPYVIVQDDVVSEGDRQTVAACALTTNLRRVSMPGNVLLEAGEANLPRSSVVEVSKRVTLAETELGAYIGSLSAERVAQILAGIAFLRRLSAPD